MDKLPCIHSELENGWLRSDKMIKKFDYFIRMRFQIVRKKVDRVFCEVNSTTYEFIPCPSWLIKQARKVLKIGSPSLLEWEILGRFS